MKDLVRSCVLGSSLVAALATPVAADRLVAHDAGIDGEYIVVMHGAAPAALSASARAGVHAAIDRLATAHGAQVARRYDQALRGFAARMTATQAAALATDPGVAYVEQNTPVYAGGIQAMPTWGLDRIDQDALPLDARYLQLGDGAGATVYVIDTGLRTTHAEFAGRVLPGAFAVDDGREVTDCNGHGSHVAGTVAGSTYGVAKRAQIVPVRVLGCDGSGTAADVIAGIDWVMANRRPLAVANLSVGGPANDAEDLAVRNLIAAGVTVVVAAGNEAQNACLRTPARVPEAITVGATTPGDARASFSNFGPCVDVSAPGVAITSAGIADDAAVAQLDGTSMAAPHVAGIAAAYLAANPGATPAQVASAIIGGATKDKLLDPKGSPNVIANARIVDATPPATEITSPEPDAVVGTAFVVLVDASDANLAGVALAVDGMQMGSQVQAPFAFSLADLAPGRHTITVTSADLAGLTTIRTVEVTVADDAGEVTGGCSTTGRGAGLAVALLIAVACVRRKRALALVACGAMAACTVGEELREQGPRYVDSDGDGSSDGIDTDGDGVPDYRFDGCPTCLPGSAPVCIDPLIDADNDGLPDGLDLDCDGTIDIPLAGGGGGGGSQSRCQTSVNERSIDCTRTNAEPARCECRIDDQLVSTCTSSLASPCSFDAANCCGF